MGWERCSSSKKSIKCSANFIVSLKSVLGICEFERKSHHPILPVLEESAQIREEEREKFAAESK